jgi:hypothetical protein
MSIATETAAEYLRVALFAAERGDVKETLYHLDRAQTLLLRPEVDVEKPGSLIGEHINYTKLGEVLAEKAKLRFA